MKTIGTIAITTLMGCTLDELLKTIKASTDFPLPIENIGGRQDGKRIKLYPYEEFLAWAEIYKTGLNTVPVQKAMGPGMAAQKTTTTRIRRIAMHTKSELLTAIERRLIWQNWLEKWQRYLASRQQHKRRQYAKKLERMGLL